MSGDRPKSRRGSLIAALGALVLVAGGVIVAVVALRHRAPTVGGERPRDAAVEERTFRTKVERGEFVFRQRGCATCHGSEGRGGVANANYVLGTVPALNEIADKIGLYEKDDADTFLRMIETGANLDAPGPNPAIEDYPRVLAQYHAIRSVIENGATAGKLDPSGPTPPLSMPAWKNVIPPSDIDALIAYLVSLMHWDAGP